MKINELRLEEGVWSNIAQATVGHLDRKGLLGKTRQYAAVGAQLEKEKQAAASQRDQEQFQKFLRDLPVALANAYASGVVVDNTASTIPESKTPTTFFRSLMESVTLNESMSKEEFVKQYLQTLFKNYKITSQLSSALDAAIKEFSNAFRYNPAIPAAKHALTSKPETDAATKIWQVYSSAKSLQGSTPTAAAAAPASRINAKYAFPKADVTVSDNKGNTFSFKKNPAAAGGEWKDETGTLISDPADQDLLNKLSLERAKTTPTPTTTATTPASTTASTAAQPLPKMTIGGQTLDPNNPADAKIIARIQQQSTQSGSPTATTPTSSAAAPARRLAGATASPRQQLRKK